MSLRLDTDESDLAEIRSRIAAARRARAAAGVAAVTFLTVIVGCLYQFQFRDHPHGIHVIILIGLVGLALFGLGRNSTSKTMTELSILRFYKSFRFHGAVVSTSATLAIAYALVIAPSPTVQARTVMPSEKQDAAQGPGASAPRQPDFPKLRLSGVILGGSRNCAIINSRTVQNGETIEGVRLVEIKENQVVVEFKGYRKTISRFASPVLGVAQKASAK